MDCIFWTNLATSAIVAQSSYKEKIWLLPLRHQWFCSISTMMKILKIRIIIKKCNCYIVKRWLSQKDGLFDLERVSKNGKIFTLWILCRCTFWSCLRIFPSIIFLCNCYDVKNQAYCFIQESCCINFIIYKT